MIFANGTLKLRVWTEVEIATHAIPLEPEGDGDGDGDERRRFLWVLVSTLFGTCGRLLGVTGCDRFLGATGRKRLLTISDPS